jgi:endonuclease IV
MGKGGVYGSFVMVKMAKGTSKEFSLKNDNKTAEQSGVYKKSPLVYIKAPIAKHFGWAEMTQADMLRTMIKKVTTTINGKTQTIEKMVPQGATGAGRAVTVKFTKPQNIGGKAVNSINIAMPTSHTFANMVQEIMESKQGTETIAAIVSPAGKSMTFKTPYNPKAKGKKLGG